MTYRDQLTARERIRYELRRDYYRHFARKLRDAFPARSGIGTSTVTPQQLKQHVYELLDSYVEQGYFVPTVSDVKFDPAQKRFSLTISASLVPVVIDQVTPEDKP